MPGNRDTTGTRSRVPLLPKELIVPVCWRFGVLLLIMCIGAISIHFTMLWKQGKIVWNKSDRLDSIMNSTTKPDAARFFLDIGPTILDSTSGNFFHSKKLEERGWRGVCADPFPTPDEDRICRLVSQPVGALSGQKVRLTDCSGRSSPFKVVLFACPTFEKTSVGIAELLKVTEAPPVIDFIHLDSTSTGDNEVEVLQSFPFKQHCARSWMVKHNNEAETMGPIKQLLQAHGCKIKELSWHYWARCPCGSSSSSVLDAGHPDLEESALPQLVRSAKRSKDVSQQKRAATKMAAALQKIRTHGKRAAQTLRNASLTRPAASARHKH